MENFKGLETLNSRKEKGSSKAHIYFLAGVAGIALAFLLIFGIKIAIVIAKASWIFIKNYWIWIIVVIIGLLFLRKILSKKRVEVHKEYPSQDQYGNY